jgi:hypothetical protein
MLEGLLGAEKLRKIDAFWRGSCDCVWPGYLHAQSEDLL